MEARRGHLREDPVCPAAWHETALEDDLIVYLSRDECSHEVAYRSDPGGAPGLDRWIEDTQGRAVFVERITKMAESLTTRTGERSEHVGSVAVALRQLADYES
jgi:hypothetical protein